MGKEIIYTGAIPLCPYCEKPTIRSGGLGSITAMYFEPRYDEHGININPDRNIRTSSYTCHQCDKNYSISGNDADGYTYNI